MSRRCSFGFLLALSAIGTLLIDPGTAAVLRVPEDHSTIESALAAAIFGDSLDIAVGIYYEHDLVWPPGVSIFGRGGSPGSVVIDAQFQGRVLGGEDLMPRNELGLLTLRNGDPEGWPGGGLRVVGDPVLHDLVIEYCRGSSRGVGLYVSGGATITDCVLRYNRTDAPNSSGGGARLDDHGPSHPIYISNLEVYGNKSSYGSGIYFNGADGYLDGLHIHDNEGDGVLVVNGEVDGIGPMLTNSLLERNTVAGLVFDAGLVLETTTIVGNGTGGSAYGAIVCVSTWDHPMNSHFSQCIVAFNECPGVTWLYPSPFSIGCFDVFGNEEYNYFGLPDLTGQDGNISEDPRFCDKGDGFYGLMPTSPCVPANNDCGLLMGAFPVSCESTNTATTSWSALKTLY